MTEAKIVWDKERIYFSFKCDDTYISAYVFNTNGPVSRDDCCEAFIAPVADGPERLDYINYEINCIGTWLTGYHAKSRNADLGRWEDGHIVIGRYIRGTCNKDDDVDTGWTLEFSVPWSHFKDFGAKFRRRTARSSMWDSTAAAAKPIRSTASGRPRRPRGPITTPRKISGR